MKCHMSDVSQNSILLHYYKYDFLKLKVHKKYSASIKNILHGKTFHFTRVLKHCGKGGLF